MIEAVVMPKAGMLMTMGKIIEWCVPEGARILKGEIIAQIETDKAVLDLAVHKAGTVLKQIYKAGTSVPVTQPIGWIGEPGDPVPETAPVVLQPFSFTSTDKTQAARETAPVLKHAGKRRAASPAARKLAADLALPLADIITSGPHNAVTRDDVLAAARDIIQDAGPGNGIRKETLPEIVPREGDTVIPLTSRERATARIMTISQQEIPAAFCTMEADITELLAARKECNAARDPENQISINDLCIAALAQALGEQPRFNSLFADDKLILRKNINIGIAVKTHSGLLVPVLQDCGAMTLGEISRESGLLVNEARSGHIMPGHLDGATITLSNLGRFGVDNFTQIITPPQTAVIGIGAVRDAVKFRDNGFGSTGKPVRCSVIHISITYDHRAGDGADAATLLETVTRKLGKSLILENT